jgi:Flp pilus assembly protein TadD
MALRTALLLSLAIGCAAPQGKRFVLPDSMRTPAPAAEGAQQQATPSLPVPGAVEKKASAASERAVVRLAEGGRVWEVEVPDREGAYELRIPLLPRAPAEEPTLADREIGAATDKGAPVASAARPKSYLAGLGRVTDLYAARRFELALIELAQIEEAFPEDARVLAMKGSLLRRLGKRDLAREAWRKALELDPKDAAVADALRELQREE